MHGTLLHELNNLVLHGDLMIDVVVKLCLHFVFKLSSLGQEIFILCWLREVFTVLGNKIEFADMGPRVEFITHWVHRPNSNVLSSSEQVHLMNFLVQRFPVQRERYPSEAVCGIKYG